MNMKKCLISFVMLTVFTLGIYGQLRLPHFFADNMVLQRDTKIPIWGWANAGAQIDVSINNKTVRTVCDVNGKWKVYFPKMKAGGPYDLTIKSRDERITLQNVLIGDVFLCSGQSNMELPIRRCMDVVGNKVKDYSNDMIRYLKIPQQYNYVRPNDDMRIIPWQNITPENCGEVSGICYFMARELQEHYHVPIGIINSAVGGTRVEAWMPYESLSQYPGYAEELQKEKYHNSNWPDSIRRMENAAGRHWEQEMISKDTVVNEWKKPGYNFKNWKIVDMFSNWSNGKNGSYWFRTTVNLPATTAGKEGLLRFGAIKDADSIFVNGQYVGNTTYQYPPRVYKVKKGLLCEGINEIVVHLMSQNGRPEFNSGKLYQLEVGDEVYTLPKDIQMCIGSLMPSKPHTTYFVDGNTGLYNAMIAPFQDFAFKGILWYQGESNMGNTGMYASLLKGMVESWRDQFHKELPIIIMQLPGYMSRHDRPVDTGWTQIRHQQYLASQQIGKSALAPTLDTGEAVDIHPQDKDVAGHRAALQMRRLAYGERKIVSSGPTPTSATIKNGKAVIKFTKESGELKLNGPELKDFAVKVDGKYVFAKAAITGPHTVSLDLPSNQNTTIRYCWDDYPSPTLFNTEGIPAPQFEIETK